MNKRGDISIVILVLGIAMVCILAFASFAFSLAKSKNSLVGVKVLEEMNLQIENKTFHGEDPTGTYLEKTKDKNGLLFSAEYLGAPQ